MEWLETCPDNLLASHLKCRADQSLEITSELQERHKASHGTSDALHRIAELVRQAREIMEEEL